MPKGDVILLQPLANGFRVDVLPYDASLGRQRRLASHHYANLDHARLLAAELALVTRSELRDLTRENSR